MEIDLWKEIGHGNPRSGRRERSNNVAASQRHDRGVAPAIGRCGGCDRVAVDLEAYERIYELTAVRKGKLPPKVREMIVVAAVSIGGYQPGIKDHVRRALRPGATK